jgi:hypothetical protein
MNSATIWIFSVSAFPIHGTLAAFTNERPRSIIMLAIQPRKDWFGRQFQAVAGELTGHAQIAWARESEVSGAYRVYDDPLDLLNHLDELGVRIGPCLGG